MDTYSTVILRDGRILAYSEFGDRQGFPVLFFHGTPGSRLSSVPSEHILHAQGIRLITIDRPGYGQSSFQKDRSILDWPRDVRVLIDTLALKYVSVIGVSGGGAYAAACAFALPERLAYAVLVSALGPFDAKLLNHGMELRNRVSLRAALLIPWMLRRLMHAGVYGHLRWFPDGYISDMRKRASLPDKQALLLPGVITSMRRGTKEAFRNGTKGYAWETLLQARDWHFPLQSIKTPVLLWHGCKDRFVPVSHGEYMAEIIPNCQASFLPEEGHLLLPRHWEEILSLCR